jgi:hypothetical protein
MSEELTVSMIPCLAFVRREDRKTKSPVRLWYRGDVILPAKRHTIIWRSQLIPIDYYDTAIVQLYPIRVLSLHRGTTAN